MRYVLVLAGVLAAAAVVGSCGGKKELTGRDFVGHCVAGLEDKAAADPEWIGAEAALTDPVVYQLGPPHIVTCASRLRDGSFSTYRVAAHCPQYLESGCARLPTPEDLMPKPAT